MTRRTATLSPFWNVRYAMGALDVSQKPVSPPSSPYFASQRCGDSFCHLLPLPLEQGVAMTAATILDRARLCRLFRFIREHEDQARAAGDEVRADKWERLLNRLLERCPRR